MTNVLACILGPRISLHKVKWSLGSITWFTVVRSYDRNPGEYIGNGLAVRSGTYVNVTAEVTCFNLSCLELLKIITCLLTNSCEFSHINNDNHNDANRM